MCTCMAHTPNPVVPEHMDVHGWLRNRFHQICRTDYACRTWFRSSRGGLCMQGYAMYTMHGACKCMACHISAALHACMVPYAHHACMYWCTACTGMVSELQGGLHACMGTLVACHTHAWACKHVACTPLACMPHARMPRNHCQHACHDVARCRIAHGSSREGV